MILLFYREKIFYNFFTVHFPKMETVVGRKQAISVLHNFWQPPEYLQLQFPQLSDCVGQV